MVAVVQIALELTSLTKARAEVCVVIWGRHSHDADGGHYSYLHCVISLVLPHHLGMLKRCLFNLSQFIHLTSNY